MPRIFNRKCDYCGKKYRGAGARFCSPICYESDCEERRVKRQNKISLEVRTRAEEREKLKLPIFDTKKYNNFLRLVGDWCITSDWHIPYHDIVLVDKMLKVCVKMNITKLIILGDFLNNGKWREKLCKKKNIGSQLEPAEMEILEKSGEIIRVLQSYFSEIVIVSGNHDLYMLQLLDGELPLDSVYRLMGLSKEELKRIKITTHPFCELNNKWHITHPKTYSQTPCNVPRRLAQKYRHSVISAHGHHFGIVTDISGNDICIESGGMFDYTKFDYKWLTDTTHPQWCNGFWIIRQNKPYGFSDLTTDWSFWT